MKYATSYFRIISPFSASDLHSMVQPCVNAFGNQATTTAFLPLKSDELVGLAVGRLQAEIGGLIADLQLRRGCLCIVLLPSSAPPRESLHYAFSSSVHRNDTAYCRLELPASQRSLRSQLKLRMLEAGSFCFDAIGPGSRRCPGHKVIPS